MKAWMRHETEAHASIYDRERSRLLCSFKDCTRSTPGHGFLGRRDQYHHLKAVHDYEKPSSRRRMSTGIHADWLASEAKRDTVEYKAKDDIAQTRNSPKENPTGSCANEASWLKTEESSLEHLWQIFHRCSPVVPEAKRMEQEKIAWRILSRDLGTPRTQGLQKVKPKPPSPHHQPLQVPQVLSKGLCSPLLLQYMSILLKLQFLENSLRILDLFCHRQDVGKNEQESEEPLAGYDIVARQRQELLKSLEVLRKERPKLRKACIIAGQSTYEIDTIMANPALAQPHREQTMYLSRATNHEGMLSIRKDTQDSRLLDGWSTTRDRINSWLLHCLRCDERQAQLHKSMLTEPDIDDEKWARDVLRHWNLDEAATGAELGTSQSLGADNSRDQSQSAETYFFSCREPGDEDPDSLILLG
ncbi:MAG: hypothetical protein Q9208_005211 [Pyrenodesmia sp. 3 TL-2023]